MRRPAPNRSPTSPDEVVEMFLHAYRVGAFPMADIPEPARRDGTFPAARTIRWYSPDPRAIIELSGGGLHIGRTVARDIRRGRFTLTSDRAFERVIRSCAQPGPTRGGPWLEETLINCYTLLHQRGHAHSIEAWSGSGMGFPAHASGASPEITTAQPEAKDRAQNNHTPQLLGGIYGISLGACFFAESMFTAIDSGGTGASSICLVTLWNHLRSCGYELLDVQMANEHTRRFGVVDIPRKQYLARLAAAIDAPDRWKPLNG